MPCDTNIPVGKTIEQRQREIQDAIKRLENELADNRVQVEISPQGAIAFKGWKDRDGVSDVCAYRKLAVDNSFALRLATKKAELMSGRKINEQVIAAGTHSHDDGKTWHPGH